MKKKQRKTKQKKKKMEKQRNQKKNEKTTKNNEKQKKLPKKQKKWTRDSGWVSSPEKLVSRRPPCSAEGAPGARFSATRRHAERAPERRSMEKTAPGCNKAPFPEFRIPPAAGLARKSRSQAHSNIECVCGPKRSNIECVCGPETWQYQIFVWPTPEQYQVCTPPRSIAI